jgi:hypothetical protein
LAILLPPFCCLQISGLIDYIELDPEIDERDISDFLVRADKLLTSKQNQRRRKSMNQTLRPLLLCGKNERSESSV